MLFEPRENSFFQDLTVIQSVLKVVGRINQDREHPKALIRPEQMYWHELLDCLETFDDMEKEVRSFLIFDPRYYTEAIDRMYQQVSRGEDPFSGERIPTLAKAEEDLEFTLEELFSQVGNRHFDLLLDNLGLSKYSTMSKSKAIKQILERKRVFHPAYDLLGMAVDKALELLIRNI